MNTESSRSISAEVELSALISLSQTADLLERALGNVFEETDRFDEVPAFMMKQGGVEFTLFGIPEGEVCDCYVLELIAETNRGIEVLKKMGPPLIGSFLCERLPNGRGYIDFSDEFAAALQSVGISARPLQYNC